MAVFQTLDTVLLPVKVLRLCGSQRTVTKRHQNVYIHICVHIYSILVNCLCMDVVVIVFFLIFAAHVWEVPVKFVAAATLVKT